ncbi:MAG: 16S rRNA (cytosine(1402)-N(4))-methyltransferase RsmH [bacterium]
MTDTPEEHRRRPRYSGKNPRNFAEKYKELQPERYADDIARVLARGDTPAGSHRSIMLAEMLQVLALQPGEVVVDATLGYGGHARVMLGAIRPGGRLYGLDIDAQELPKTEFRLRTAGFSTEEFIARQLNFAALPQLLAEEGLQGVDALFADLGVSSMQIDNPARGFTFKRTGPLDLRMNPLKGEPAAAMLVKLDEAQLVKLLQDNADEEYAERIAHVVTAQRGEITTTTALATAVRAAVPADAGDDPVRRTFQALRIAVNGEFSALDALLAAVPYCLNPGGRIAVITFHSGEDRRVKQAFKVGLQQGLYSAIAQEVLRPNNVERYSNPRSASAKMRWAVRA